MEELDKRLLIQLRDGRKIVGFLRSFDQFANLVLETASERIIVGNLYAEKPLGLYVVRGENVVLLGEVDETKDPPYLLQVRTVTYIALPISMTNLAKCTLLWSFIIPSRTQLFLSAAGCF